MTEQISPNGNERGFTLIEVAVASVISMTGLVFLATLFTLAIAQNKHVKQATSSVTFAQEKIEKLSAIPNTDTRLTNGGDLNNATTVTLADGTTISYSDTIYVDESGTVTVPAPNNVIPTYNRYWKIEPDATMGNSIIVSVRVAAVNPGRGKLPEETTLATIRVF
jgi:prepilin-type N-terminal cleavage/methylation domain-containing protein